ncbi:MAG TPA: RidA family protein, partial [Methylomirabilota bacterium]|nr:RidA family protein [Methylomirabilota bacterium]
LGEWGILVGDDNPIARTNVAPLLAPPPEPSLYAFAYTVAGSTLAPTFVVAGAGEMRDRARGAEGIVRHGDTSAEAMREKARFVMNIMQERMRGLGADWTRLTALDVYTAQPIHGLLEDLLRPAGAAAIHGLRWFPSRPPIQGLEFEVDLRGVTREIIV